MDNLSDIHGTAESRISGDTGGNVLVFQHLESEHPGAIGTQLAEAGYSLTVVELDEGEVIPPLAHFDMLLVMGGPMDVWQEDAHPWLVAEKAAIRTWVGDLGRPYLGVCLGHQLLADALGGETGLMPAPEVGVAEITLTAAAQGDPAFRDLPQTIRGLQWHGAQVVSPPPGGVVLATNSSCAIQALRVGACAWGVQFHVEVGATTIEEWAAVAEYEASLAAVGGGDAAWLADQVTCHLDTMRAAATAILSGVLNAVPGRSLPTEAAS